MTRAAEGPYQSAALCSVWTRNHFQIVAVRVGKVDPASTVIMIDLARATTPRISPVLDSLLPDTGDDGIEIRLGNQESIVLRLDGSVGVREIERHAVVEFDHFKRAEPNRRPSPQYRGQETGGLAPVRRVHDGVIELSAHGIRRSSTVSQTGA